MPYTDRTHNNIFVLVLFKPKLAKRSMYELDVRGDNPYFLHFASDDALCYEHQLDIGFQLPKFDKTKQITQDMWYKYWKEVGDLNLRVYDIAMEAGKTKTRDKQKVAEQKQGMAEMENDCDKENKELWEKYPDSMKSVAQTFIETWKNNNLRWAIDKNNNPMLLDIVEPSDYKTLHVGYSLNKIRNGIKDTIGEIKQHIFKWNWQHPFSNTAHVSEQKWLLVQYTFNRIKYLYARLIRLYADWVEKNE